MFSGKRFGAFLRGRHDKSHTFPDFFGFQIKQKIGFKRICWLILNIIFAVTSKKKDIQMETYQ